MTKILICYLFEELDPKQRKQFHRRMFGTEETSHGGKYTTVCKGILSDIEYDKPVRSVIVIDEKHKEKVIRLLKSYSAKIRGYKVIPDSSV
ncbi:MAG: hypothetical protein V1678_04030 [Candidatus Aenigmatarchaeota archaeon]